MDVSCKRCGKDIPASDINLAQMVAKCSGCDAVFGLAVMVGHSGGPAKLGVGLPEGWTLLEDEAPLFRSTSGSKAPPKELAVRWRWFHVSALKGVFEVLVLGGLWVFFYRIADSLAEPPWWLVALLVVHAAVGVTLFYRTLAKLLNATTLSIKGATLSLRHHPLPWPGGLSMPVEGIQQVFCVEKEHRGRKGGYYYDYAVMTERESGADVALVTGLEERTQAFFIEQKLERALGIEDVGVVGELPK